MNENFVALADAASGGSVTPAGSIARIGDWPGCARGVVSHSTSARRQISANAASRIRTPGILRVFGETISVGALWGTAFPPTPKAPARLAEAPFGRESGRPFRDSKNAGGYGSATRRDRGTIA